MKTAAARKAKDGLTAAAHRFGPCQAKDGVKRKGSGKLHGVDSE